MESIDDGPRWRMGVVAPPPPRRQRRSRLTSFAPVAVPLLTPSPPPLPERPSPPDPSSSVALRSWQRGSDAVALVFLLLVYFMVATDFKKAEEVYILDLPDRVEGMSADPFELDEEPLRIMVRSTGADGSSFRLAVALLGPPRGQGPVRPQKRPGRKTKEGTQWPRGPYISLC